jgi:CRISPR type III-A-associated protein Csm2
MDNRPGKFKSFEDMGSRGHGGGGGGRHSDSPPDLPVNYLSKGYFDEKGNLLKEIFIEWPESLTQSLRRTKPPATKNSLRAFYSMLRMAKNQFDAQRRNNAMQERAQGDARTQLLKLHTAAQYQSTRRVISSLCQRFLNRNIDLVLSKGDTYDNFAANFDAFVEHFQAVIAYLPERAER